MADGIDENTEIEDTSDVSNAFDFLQTTKVLLNIAESDESIDTLLNVYIELTRQSILNYCNISELPSALNYTLCAMCADTYREIRAMNTTGEVVGNVGSISEDGRSVSFTNGSEFKAAIEDKISRKTELNRFKKLYRLD